MIKLIGLFRRPAHPAALERHYRDVHPLLARRIPKLVRMAVNRPGHAPWGAAPAYHLIAEPHFVDSATCAAALRSPENRAAGQDPGQFAKDLVTFVTVSDA